MIKIAITGGICSGKSTLCNQLENIGYKIFYSDNVAKTIVNSNAEIKKEIIGEFSEKAFSSEGYNSKFIASIVFSNKEKLDSLNKIFSSYINKEFDSFCKINSSEKVIFYESALIFEHDKQKDFDYVFCCYASQETIIKRLKKRNGYSDEEIEKRIASQMSQADKMSKSDFLINTETEHFLNQTIEKLNQITNQ